MPHFQIQSIRPTFLFIALAFAATATAQTCPAPGPFGGTAPIAPNEIQAEDFDCGTQNAPAYMDTTPGNAFPSQYRAGESVDIFDLADGGRTVRNFDTNEWMNYTFQVTEAGTYNVGISAASAFFDPSTGAPIIGSYNIELNGSVVVGSDVSVPQTPNWDTYQWVDRPSPGFFLNPGTHVLKLVSKGPQAYRVDKLRIYADGACNAAPLRAFSKVPGVPEAPDNVPLGGVRVPASGSVVLEAEYFDCGGPELAYHDTEPALVNSAGQDFRTDGQVEILNIQGGRAVKEFLAGEWMVYTIDVQADGTYNIGVNYAASMGGGSTNFPRAVRFKLDGNPLGSNLTLPPTANWETYAYEQLQGIALTKGRHRLTIESVTPPARIDSIQIAAGASTADPCSHPGLTMCIGFEADQTSFERIDFNFSCNQNNGECAEVKLNSQGTPTTQFSVTAHNRGGDDGTQSGDPAFDDNDWAHDTMRIRLEPNLSRDGSGSIRFTTRQLDICVHTGGRPACENSWERSEIKFSTADTDGSEKNPAVAQWWSHSVRFPSGEFVPPAANHQANVFFQFHQEPPAPGGPPSFHLSVRRDATGQLILHSHNRNSAGTYQQCLHTPLQYNAWYDFVHKIVWSDDGSGSHEIWMQKDSGGFVKVLNLPDRATLFSGAWPVYLKLGTYHDQLPTQSTTVVHDRLRRGTSYDAVRAPTWMTTQELPSSVTPCS